MRYQLLHLSDIHTGWHFDMHVAEQLARQAHDIRPDLLVISGDLVLRSDLIGQWLVATAYLTMLPQPQLIVPGNHDVSLFNGIYRLFAPLKRYKRFISPNLNPVFSRSGLAVVGGNTAHGLTVDGGVLSRKQLQRLDQLFTPIDATACKVLVLHHHIVSPPGCTGLKARRNIINAADVVRLMDTHHVELFLCGHVHISHVGTTNGFLPGVQSHTIISQCGTSTSRRGRGSDKGQNSFHVIGIDDDTIDITPYFYRNGRFVATETQLFPRRKVV